MEHFEIFIALLGVFLGAILAVAITLITLKKNKQTAPARKKLWIVMGVLIVLFIALLIVFFVLRQQEKETMYESEIGLAETAAKELDYDAIIEHGHQAGTLAYDMETRLRAQQMEAQGYYLRWTVEDGPTDFSIALRMMWNIIGTPEYGEFKYYRYALSDACMMYRLSGAAWDDPEWAYIRDTLEAQLETYGLDDLSGLAVLGDERLSEYRGVYNALSSSYIYGYQSKLDNILDETMALKALLYSANSFAVSGEYLRRYGVAMSVDPSYYTSMNEMLDVMTSFSMVYSNPVRHLEDMAAYCETVAGDIGVSQLDEYVMLKYFVGKVDCQLAVLTEDDTYYDAANRTLSQLLNYDGRTETSLLNVCYYLAICGKCSPTDAEHVLGIVQKELAGIDAGKNRNLHDRLTICTICALLSDRQDGMFPFGKNLIEDVCGNYRDFLSVDDKENADALYGFYETEDDETARAALRQITLDAVDGMGAILRGA